MDVVFLARLQFYITIGFHFIFVPINIGLSWIIVWYMIKYRRTKDPVYKTFSRFWIKIFAITFGIGVPTGFIMAFQFGTNWSAFSRIAGEIFGSMLVIEAIYAFFFEAVFLAVLLQGWNNEKVSERMLLVSAIIVAISVTVSAFFIVAANSWMHTPAGFQVVNGKYEISSFIKALFNPSTILRFLHTLTACFIITAFFVIGISAGYLLKAKHVQLFTISLKIGLIIALIATLSQGIIGHFSSLQVADTQPAKFAAQEGIFITQNGASLTLFGLINENGEIFKIAIPRLLSFLTYLDPNATVTGLDAFPVADRPPVILTYYSFHFMVYLGVLFALFSLLGIFFLWERNILEQKRYLKIARLAIPLPIIATQLGWITTEVGRQPWIIYGVLRTIDASSPIIDAGEVIFSLTLFSLLYIGLFVIWIITLKRILKKGPDSVKVGYGDEVVE